MSNENLKQDVGGEVGETIVQRLTSYPYVLDVWDATNQFYERAKEYPLLSTGINYAEQSTQSVYKVLDDRFSVNERGLKALDTLDQRFGVNERGLQALDVLELQATQISDLYTRSGKIIQDTRQVVSDRALNAMTTFIDTTDNVIDRYLPETEQEGVDEDSSESADFGQLTPRDRILFVREKIRTRLESRIRKLSDSDSALVMDLLQFATQHITEPVNEVKTMYTYVTRIIDEQISTIKDRSLKTVVATVSSLAGAAEILSRKVGEVVPKEKVQDIIENITSRTKEIVLSFSDPDVSAFSRSSLASLTNLNESVRKLGANATSSLPILEQIHTTILGILNKLKSSLGIQAELLQFRHLYESESESEFPQVESGVIEDLTLEDCDEETEEGEVEYLLNEE